MRVVPHLKESTWLVKQNVEKSRRREWSPATRKKQHSAASPQNQELNLVNVVDERRMRAHLREVVGRTEETDAERVVGYERGSTCQMERCKRTKRTTRKRVASSADCKPGAGEVAMKMQKLCTLTFAMALIERYSGERVP
jgi:hypothetical protein